MLDIEYTDDDGIVPNSDDTDDADRVETTVVELAGVDRVGLLADVTDLLTASGCDVRSAAVWTAKGRVAFVLSITEKGRAVEDGDKAARLAGVLHRMMSGGGGGEGSGGGSGGGGSPGGGAAASDACVVHLERVRGDVRHDRRLHTLLLREEARGWGGEGGSGSVAAAAAAAAPSPPAGPPTPGGSTRPSSAQEEEAGNGVPPVALPSSASAFPARPAITVRPCPRTGYWTVTVASRDRPKLLFDTLCTLADLEYDVFHATVGASPLLAHGAPALPSAASLGSASSLDGAGREEGWAAGPTTGGDGPAAALHHHQRHGCTGALSSSGRRPAAGGIAHQEYYVKPRWGGGGGGIGGGSGDGGLGGWGWGSSASGGGLPSSAPPPVVPAPLLSAVGPPPAHWDPARGRQLAAALEASILRRVPRGLKLHVRSLDRFGCLANLTAVLRGAGLTITRAKVRTFASDRSSGHTFYVMGLGGAAPDGLVPPDREAVRRACAAAGGHLADPAGPPAAAAAGGEGGAGCGGGGDTPGTCAFSYSFLSRRAAAGRHGGGGGSAAATAPAAHGNGVGAPPGGGQGWHGPPPAGGGSPGGLPGRGVPTSRARVGSLPGASPDSDGSF